MNDRRTMILEAIFREATVRGGQMFSNCSINLIKMSSCWINTYFSIYSLLECGLLANKRSFGDLVDDEDDIFGSKKVPFTAITNVYTITYLFYLLDCCLWNLYYSVIWLHCSIKTCTCDYDYDHVHCGMEIEVESFVKNYAYCIWLM